jgi:sugar phosphate isomerase/epimerase
MKLGLHTFCLNLQGLGQWWAGFTLPWPRQLTTEQLLDRLVEWGLDGVHLDDAVLESLEEPYLRHIGELARERGLFIEYNFSMDWAKAGVGIQHDLGQALDIAQALGADVIKTGIDMVRPRPVAASKFHPDVMATLEEVAELLRRHAPTAEERGIRIAVENHTDTFSEEIIWLLDQVDHPHVGACIDTVNAYHITEDPTQAVERLAPHSFTNHFQDAIVKYEIWGFRSTGCALGDGDLDIKRCYELMRDVSPCDRIIIETALDIPLGDKETAIRIEEEALLRSIRYCRDVLGVGKEEAVEESS